MHLNLQVTTVPQILVNANASVDLNATTSTTSRATYVKDIAIAMHSEKFQVFRHELQQARAQMGALEG